MELGRGHAGGDPWPLEVRLTGVVGELVARPQRVDHSDVQVGSEDRQVDVAAVPQHDVRVNLCGPEDVGVVAHRVPDQPGADRRLVLLPLLDGGVGRVDVGQGSGRRRAVPYRMSRIGALASPEPGDDREAWGICNPASARDATGALRLFPRMVAKGNLSRIGRATVHLDDQGRPVGLGPRETVLEPVEA